MEADWEYEIGGGAPVIDAGWAGLVDLTRQPERIGEIAETAALPELTTCLLQLNQAASPVWTSKCDLWGSLEEGSFDADEMDATAGAGVCATGSYIDLLARESGRWHSPESAARDCRSLCAKLHAATARNCRADLVIREACFGPDRYGFGITAYLTACGADLTKARNALGQALDSFARTVASSLDTTEAKTPLQ